MPRREIDPVLIERLDLRQAPRSAPPPAPRRRVRRVAIALVAGSVVLVATGQLLAMAVRPVAAIYRTGQENRRLEAELAALEARRAELRRLAEYLKTPRGIEEEARRHGWVRKGEVALQVIREEPREPAPEPEPAEAPQPPPTRWERVREFFHSIGRALRGAGGP